jgi:hypothetical protein
LTFSYSFDNWPLLKSGSETRIELFVYQLLVVIGCWSLRNREALPKGFRQIWVLILEGKLELVALLLQDQN